MCLILFARDAHPRYRLVLGANRDEYFSRPTASAGYWEDAPSILAGRDLEAQGTWLGVTRDRRIAAVTYYREPVTPSRHAPSRGKLPVDFLAGTMAPEEYLESLRREEARYGGFNLLFGVGDRLLYHTNRGVTPAPVTPGIHGLSNGLLDTPWPKVKNGRDRLNRLLREPEIDPEELFLLLRDPAPFPDPLLPDTGFGVERERHLSPLFVSGNEYGTRSSTVILLDRDNRLIFQEQTYTERQELACTAQFVIESQ